MTMDLGIAIAAMAGYLVVRLAPPMIFGREPEWHEESLRIASIGLTIIATGFVGWGLYLIFGAFSQADLLSKVFVAGYGIMQFGIAAILYRLPAMCGD